MRGARAPSARRRAEGRESNVARVLVVDDSSFQRRNLRFILEGAGHEVLEAQNGEAGLAQARDQRPDCVLVDLIMPEVGGLELLASMRRSSPATPVIVVTADIQESVREQCAQMGAAAVINKPVKGPQLLAAVAQALAAAKDSFAPDR
jgi:CheY-like chemotaxis protein